MIAYHGDPGCKADQIIEDLISDGLIQVESEAGKAFSRRSRYRQRALGTVNNGGYVVCTLHRGGMRRQVKLHRIVWIAANGAIPKGKVIDHINRNRADNRLCNLRLADAKGNAQNRRSYCGELNPAARLSPDAVRLIRASYPALSYGKIAQRFGVSKSLVAQVIRGEVWR